MIAFKDLFCKQPTFVCIFSSLPSSEHKSGSSVPITFLHISESNFSIQVCHINAANNSHLVTQPFQGPSQNKILKSVQMVIVYCFLDKAVNLDLEKN